MTEVVMTLKYDPGNLSRWMRKHPGEVVEALGQALVGAAEDCMFLSKAIFVPVISGNLRSTGEVGNIEISQGILSIEMSYGGPAAPYAQVVHDAPSDWGQGKNQYLAQPFYQIGRDLDERVKRYTADLYR